MSNVRNSSRNAFHRAGALLVLALVGALAWTPRPAVAVEDVNRIVLRVNNQILTLHDFEKRKTQEVTAILSNPNLGDTERQDALANLGPTLMQQIFQEMLLLSRAEQLGISVAETEVDNAVRQVQERQGLSNEVELLRALASAGLTLEQLRDNMRRDLIYNEVVSRDVMARIQISEEELRAVYRAHLDVFTTPEKRWLEEVIVLDSSSASPEEQAGLAEEIHQMLVADPEADLESVIEPYAAEGLTSGLIDLGWLMREELGDLLEGAAWSLEKGGYSAPVAGRGGWHILHLRDLQEVSVRSFDEVQSQIVARERSLRYEKELRGFLGELERSAYIREDLPQEAVGYRDLAAAYTPENELELFQRPDLPAAPRSGAEAGDAGAGDDPSGEATSGGTGEGG